MNRYAGVERIRARDPQRAARLMKESLATASDEYALLASRIRNHSHRLNVPSPHLLLLWFSECDLGTGCRHPGLFPQFYTEGADVAVRRVARRIGARVVDASYPHVASPKSITLGHCDACKPLVTEVGRKPCSMDDARGEINAPAGHARRTNTSSGFGVGTYGSTSPVQGCTRTCSAVMPGYYPHKAAHGFASHVLLAEVEPMFERPMVASQSSVRGASASLLSANVAGRGGLMANSLLPRIDVSKKIFFNHVHKCAGSSFTEFLRSLPGARWCSDLVGNDMVHPSSTKALVSWWFDGLPNCTLLALELPELGQLATIVSKHRGEKLTAAGDPAIDFYEPQVLTFYRDPYERCISEWRYEQAQCHPPDGLETKPGATVQYCQGWFLPRFDQYNETLTHRSFVRVFCNERVSADYERHGLDFRELARSDRLLFVGIKEDYFASICLFWYQTGQFPYDTCSCEAAREARVRLNKSELFAKGLRPSFSYSGPQARVPGRMPGLRMSREEFERRSPNDVALYREALALFNIRVRQVESRVQQKFSGCSKA